MTYRPGPNAVTVAVNFDGYGGGANTATNCILVDLRTARVPTACSRRATIGSRPWSRSLAPTSRSSSSRSPASRKRWSPESLAKLLREPAHYCWRANRLELIFNAYDVGPYAAGPFEVYVSCRPVGATVAERRADHAIRSRHEPIGPRSCRDFR